MINGQKIVFVTFSDKRFEAYERLRMEALSSGWFDNVVAGNEDILEPWYAAKYKQRFADYAYGYWMWKSYLIHRELEKLDEGDYLVYLDAGSSINPRGLSRLKAYLQMLNKHETGVLLFKQGLREVEWTKGDVFAYFNALADDRFVGHMQTSASVILVKKSFASTQMMDEWFYVAHNQYDLLNATPSVTPNFPDYKEHRYDQSILSMLSVKYNAIELWDNEVYTPDDDWNTKMKEFPFWVTRLKKRKVPFIVKVKHWVKKLIKR